MSDSQMTPESDAENQAIPVPKPANVPEKFWDPVTGVVRLDALLKSYHALEQRFSKPDPDDQDEPAFDRDTALRFMGRPDEPHGYAVSCAHGYFAPDPDLNARFHALGLTQDQVQAVYDMAAEKLVPAILDITANLRAEQEVEKLQARFGGAEKWREMARQLLAFGQKNIAPDLLEKMAASADGVQTLHDIMVSKTDAGGIKPGLGARGQDENTEQIYALMRDPKYWRDHDPKIIRRVEDGFRRLYE